MKYTEAERLQAAQWFLDIREVEEPAPDMLHDWVQWMEAADTHRLAFEAVERTWWRMPVAAMGASGNAAPDDDDNYDGSISIHEWQQRRAALQANAPVFKRTAVPSPWRRRWLAFATAASLAGVAILLASHWPWPIRAPAPSREFATSAGEQLHVTLSDGSLVDLGPRSRLMVAYTPAGRDVRLETGEGFFAVQKNAARPFRVHVLSGLVTAVGTAFDVRTMNDHVVVSVAEGIVQVGSAENASGFAAGRDAGPPSAVHGLSAVRLTRGDSISFVSRDGNAALEEATLSKFDPLSVARWREGRFEYSNEPLRDVLTDIARYTDRPIVLAHAAQLTVRFTGTVSKDGVDEWLQSLPSVFPVSVRADAARVTVSPVPDAAVARDR
jgi:transmembrane sensor